MMVRVGKRNSLEALEEQVAEEHEKKRKKRNHRYNTGDRTRIAADVRKGKRKPPPVPKNKSLKEIEELHDQDLNFRHKSGHPRLYQKEGTENEPKVPVKELTFREAVRADQQKRTNARRARGRKWEARVVKAQEVLETHTDKADHELDIYDEEKAIAEGILSLDDWDNEELIRGYRRNRAGHFGKQPKYIPREVQQEAFRRLVHRGNRKLREAYMKTIEGLVELAHTGESEKVRLEAIKELLNRIVGKVPDIVVGAQMEQPWESILGDSLIPFGEDPNQTLDLTPGDDGVARMDPIIVEAKVVTEAAERKEALRSRRAKARRARAKSDSGALTPDDVSGSGTGQPTTSVAQAPESTPRKKKPRTPPTDDSTPRRKKVKRDE